jgi:hypothetical protein
MSSIGFELRNKIENANIEERVEMIRVLYNKWVCPENTNPSVLECLQTALDNLNLEINDLKMGSFERAVSIAKCEILYLRLYTIESGEYIEDQKDIETKINAVCNSIVSADNAIRYNFKLQNAIIKYDGKGDDLFDFTPIDPTVCTSYQNLLLFLLENLSRRGLRRYNGACYEKVYTPEGNDTHCWKQTMTLKEFIYSSINKNTHFEMWQNLTSARDNVTGAVNYLSNHVGADFEDIKKDRHVFSFNDGIYITCKLIDGKYYDEWVPYASKTLSSDIISCNYFNINFDPEGTSGQSTRDMSWWDIIVKKCPLFMSIMEHQEWDIEVRKWLCIFIGRCLYNVNELDGWQIIGFLLGQAGTGKSTVLNYILKILFEPNDVVSMGNNIERKFGLQSIYDKLLFIAPEIKGNFGLEQAEFQSMVSGETLCINRKGIGAISVNWVVPGMLAGNEVPNWTDNAGSIARRILVFMFNKKVRKGDTQLGNKLRGEIGYIIQACNRAYLEAVNKYGSEDIWNIVPEYFRKTRDELMESTNALAGFLGSDRVIRDPEKKLFVREGNFIEAFNNYCRDMNIPKQRWNGQYCMGPFSEFGVEVDRHFTYEGITGTYFFGVDVKEIKVENKDIFAEDD